MLKLRGHHLICLIAFQGEGYSKAFARNFKKLQKLYLNNPDEKVKVVAGPDMACKKCPHLSNNTCISPIDSPNSRIIALDKKAFKLLKITPGIYNIGVLHQHIRLLTKLSLRNFCRNCSWYGRVPCQKLISDWILVI
ncbi:MAG: DUF1284 domain-containing protein [bacterium]|nr:DUF1284 domain-containing protein [bacterium]MDD5354550.1 DUF1284 domain-containing protein [bacterium]